VRLQNRSVAEKFASSQCPQNQNNTDHNLPLAMSEPASLFASRSKSLGGSSLRAQHLIWLGDRIICKCRTEVKA
jgi:hypothetical protein